jgi:L-seryl-tRNA(Ser) seleniumtransferase
LDLISREIAKVPGVSTEFFTPDIANHVPHMRISWDSRVRVTPQQVSQALRKSNPSIVMGGAEGKPGLAMNSFMLQPGEDQIVAERLSAILRQQST